MGSTKRELAKVKKCMDILNTVTTAKYDGNLRKKMVKKLSKIVYEFEKSSNLHIKLRGECKRMKNEFIPKMLQVWIELFGTGNPTFLVNELLIPLINSSRSKENGIQHGELFLTYKYLETLLPKLSVKTISLIPLRKSRYVKRMLLDNPQIDEQYWRDIRFDGKKFPPVIIKSKIVDGIDKIFNIIHPLTSKKKITDIVYQMNSKSKIVSIVLSYSAFHKQFQLEAAICVLQWKLTNAGTSVYMQKIMLWVACAILRCPLSGSRKELSDSILDALCQLFVWITKHSHTADLENVSEFVAVRQHLGKNRSHQMDKIDQIASSKFSDWNLKVATNPIKSREDFVTPSDGKLHPQLAYTFHDADSVKKLDLSSISVENPETLNSYEIGQQKLTDNFESRATKNDTQCDDDKRRRPAKVIHEPSCKLYKVLKDGSVKVLNRPCLGRSLRSSTTLKRSSKNAAAVYQCTCSARNLQLPIPKQVIYEPPTSEEIFNQCIQIVPTCPNTLEIKTELFKMMLGVNEDNEYLGLIVKNSDGF